MNPHKSLRVIPERFKTLLSSTAEMLGAQLRLRLPGMPAPFVQSPASICIDCSKSGPEMFRACQARQGDGIPAITPTPTLQQWICPKRCEVVTLPVTVPNGSSGMLIAVRPPREPDAQITRDDPDMLRFLNSLARLLSEHLALTNELSNLSGELSHRSEELNLLHAISGRLTEQEDMRQTVRGILSRGRATLGADAAVLSIEPRRIFELALGPSVEERLRGRTRHWRQLGNLLSARFDATRRSYHSGTLAELGVDGVFLGLQAQIVGVAVRLNEEIEGSLSLVFLGCTNRKLSTEIRLLDSLSERVSAAVANSELYENLKDFLMATVKSLVTAIDAKDPYTSGHSERVNILSMLLGKTMGLGKEELDVLRWASILHDVGKIGMPESILNKPGKLTAEEYEVVKEHPERGYRVISPIRQLATASLGVRCHHEKIDGQGYPLGIRGTEIPLSARIIAVADTYDALTSKRPYRQPRTPDQALSVISSVRGTQLDPSVVEILEDLMPFIREHQVMLQASEVETPYKALDDSEAEKAA